MLCRSWLNQDLDRTCGIPAARAFSRSLALNLPNQTKLRGCLVRIRRIHPHRQRLQLQLLASMTSTSTGTLAKRGSSTAKCSASLEYRGFDLSPLVLRYHHIGSPKTQVHNFVCQFDDWNDLEIPIVILILKVMFLVSFTSEKCVDLVRELVNS